MGTAVFKNNPEIKIQISIVLFSDIIDMKEKSKRKDKLARHFTEGWIEFQSKRVAKEVAANLNNTPVGGKKRSKAHDVLWNIKYLPKYADSF